MSIKINSELMPEFQEDSNLTKIHYDSLNEIAKLLDEKLIPLIVKGTIFNASFSKTVKLSEKDSLKFEIKISAEAPENTKELH